MTLESIKSSIEKKWHGRPAELSLSILDHVKSASAYERKMLSFNDLLYALGLQKVDGDLLAALNILVSSSQPLLSRGYLLIDDDGNEFEISSDEVADAKKHSSLVHPETGEEISDYERQLVLYFYPSPKLSGSLE